MKKFAAVLLLIAVACYAWLPYRAVAQFENAIHNADEAALKRIVDFPALRESLKQEIKAKALGSSGTKPSIASALGSHLAGAMVDQLVDQMVTPAVLATTLKLKGSSGDKAASFREKRWSGLNEMTAKGDGETMVVFRLTGLSGWKVVGIREEAAR